MLLQLRLSPGDQSLSNLWLQFVTLSRYLPSYNQLATSWWARVEDSILEEVAVVCVAVWEIFFI